MSVDDQRVLYVRIRGRAHGPLPVGKLKEMARKGQFSRIHHVSDDGQSWRSAAELPELFEGEQPAANRPGTAATSQSRGTDQVPAEPKVWYFSRNNEPVGPLTISDLRGQATAAQVLAETLVWREGQEQWAPAGTVAELRSLFPAAQQHVQVQARRKGRRRRGSGHDREDAEERPVGVSTLGSLRGIAPWSLFLAILGYIWSALMFFGGIYLLVLDPDLVLVGSSDIMLGCAVFVGALFLTQQANAFSQVQRNREVDDLDAGLRASGRFWTYVGFVAIVITVVQVFLAIFFFSVIARAGRPDFWGVGP